METKKISLKEWEEIGTYHPAAKWARPLCSHRMWKDEKYYYRQASIAFIPYLLLVIPFTIIDFFACCIDGGLKNFAFPVRTFGTFDTITPNQNSYERAKKVWGKD